MPKSKNKRKSGKKKNQRSEVNEYMLRIGKPKIFFNPLRPM